MVAPGMVRAHARRAGARWLQSPSKIRLREGSNFVADTLGHHLVVESPHRLTQGGEVIPLIAIQCSARLIRMRIKVAQRAEEDLTLHRDSGQVSNLDQLRDLPQLITQRGGGEHNA